MQNKKGILGTIGIILIVIAAVVIIMLLWVWSGYNNFITLGQGVDGQWSQVESQYQRQSDLFNNQLIPLLNSSVGVETKFVKDVIAARTAYSNATTQLAKDKAGYQLNTMIMAVGENYPQLQASKQYTQIIDEAAGTQNRITTERGRYIESIKAYNLAVMKFPGNVLALMFGFEKKEFYQAPAGTNTPQLGTGQLPQ